MNGFLPSPVLASCRDLYAPGYSTAPSDARAARWGGQDDVTSSAAKTNIMTPTTVSMTCQVRALRTRGVSRRAPSPSATNHSTLALIDPT